MSGLTHLYYCFPICSTFIWQLESKKYCFTHFSITLKILFPSTQTHAASPEKYQKKESVLWTIQSGASFHQHQVFSFLLVVSHILHIRIYSINDIRDMYVPIPLNTSKPQKKIKTLISLGNKLPRQKKKYIYTPLENS